MPENEIWLLGRHIAYLFYIGLGQSPAGGRPNARGRGLIHGEISNGAEVVTRSLLDFLRPTWDPRDILRIGVAPTSSTERAIARTSFVRKILPMRPCSPGPAFIFATPL